MTHSFPTLRSSYLACAVGLDRGGETAERVRLVHDLAGEDTVRHFCSLAISGTGRASFGFAWNSRSNAAATPMTKRSEWRRPTICRPKGVPGGPRPDRKSGVEGKRGSVRLDLGGRRNIKKKHKKPH